MAHLTQQFILEWFQQQFSSTRTTCYVLISNRKDVPLGSVGVHLLDHKSRLLTGTCTYKLWDGPANPIGKICLALPNLYVGSCVENTITSNPAVLMIELEDYPQRIVFPTPEIFGLS